MIKNVLTTGLIFIIVSGVFEQHSAQENWDNQLYTGNKVIWGGGQWKYSGEFQVRLLDNFSALDRWYVEGAANFLPSEHWEFAPDLRFSVKPESQELRPGLGGLYKFLTPKLQYVNQVKWQADINSNGNVSNGVRWAMFLNYLLTDSIIPNLVGGVFYSWKDNFEGWEFIRFGAGVNVRFNPVQSLNLSYFFG